MTEGETTLQPFILALGPSMNEISNYLVYIDQEKGENVFCKFKNLIKAVDMLFRIFMVLNLKYPKQCEQIWLLLQRYVYNIQTPYDMHSTTVLQTISDLKGAICDHNTKAHK